MNDEQTNFVPDITLTAAMSEPTLFGKIFAAPSFWPWRTLAKLIDGEPLTEPREIELFEQCSGRKYNREARHAVRRLILLAGRRAGKDRFLSAVDFIGAHRISFQTTLPKQEIDLSRVPEATAVAVYVENATFFQIELDAFPLGECKKGAPSVKRQLNRCNRVATIVRDFSDELGEPTVFVPRRREIQQQWSVALPDPSSNFQ